MGLLRAAVYFIVITIILITTVVCFTNATYRLVEPLSVNAQTITRLELETKIKALQNSDPKDVLRHYLNAKRRTGHIQNVDDATMFPPHPSINDIMGLTIPGNPWAIPGDVLERSQHPNLNKTEHHNLLHLPQNQKVRLEAVPVNVLRRYVDAILVKKLRRRIKNLKKKSL